MSDQVRPSVSAEDSTSNGRDARGRFTAGNLGGPGNPFARQVAALRQLLLDAVTPELMQAIVQALCDKARFGDLGATKLLLQYTLGKPAEAVQPDRLDVEEWQHFRETADMPGELAKVATKMGPELCLTTARMGRMAATEKWGRYMSDVIRHPRKHGLPYPDVEELLQAERPSANGGNGEAPPSANGGNGEAPPSAYGGNGSVQEWFDRLKQQARKGKKKRRQQTVVS